MNDDDCRSSEDDCRRPPRHPHGCSSACGPSRARACMHLLYTAVLGDRGRRAVQPFRTLVISANHFRRRRRRRRRRFTPSADIR